MRTEKFERERPDMVLADLRMPGLDGLDVLAKVREDSPETPIVIVSGTGVLGDAVEALRLGAWEYILKPIQDMGVLLHVVRKSLEKARLKEENIRYQQHLKEMVEQRTSELDKTNRELLAEIDERKRVEQQREELFKILASKNEELESIVWISSHDLRSPLVNIEGHSGELNRTIEEIGGVFRETQLPLDVTERITSLLEEIPVSIDFIQSSVGKMNDLLKGLVP